jgi:putative transposase
LVRFAKNLGSALNELATIAHPSTIRRWIREASDKVSKTRKKVGRPRTAEQIEKLILKLAKDNSRGDSRILGELKKLGIESVTRKTLKNILKRNGNVIRPKRGPGTWDEFIKRHAKTMWQCDFYSKRVVSKTGLRDLLVMILLHIETRRVFISPASYHPNEEWVLEQADAFKQHSADENLSCDILMHDRDTKFTASFDEAFSCGKRDIEISAFRSPNTNAYVERFIQSLQQECLDHFVVFGKEFNKTTLKIDIADAHQALRRKYLPTLCETLRIAVSTETHRLLAEHLTSEYFIKTQARGRSVDEWKQRPEQPDNHWFDCLAEASFGASMLGCVLPGTDATEKLKPGRLSFKDLRYKKRK